MRNSTDRTTGSRGARRSRAQTLAGGLTAAATFLVAGPVHAHGEDDYPSPLDSAPRNLTEVEAGTPVMLYVGIGVLALILGFVAAVALGRRGSRNPDANDSPNDRQN